MTLLKIQRTGINRPIMFQNRLGSQSTQFKVGKQDQNNITTMTQSQKVLT